MPLSHDDRRQLVQGRVESPNTVRLNRTRSDMTPEDMLAGRTQEIHEARDRKLQHARKQRPAHRQRRLKFSPRSFHDNLRAKSIPMHVSIHRAEPSLVSSRRYDREVRSER